MLVTDYLMLMKLSSYFDPGASLKLGATISNRAGIGQDCSLKLFAVNFSFPFAKVTLRVERRVWTYCVETRRDLKDSCLRFAVSIFSPLKFPSAIAVRLQLLSGCKRLSARFEKPSVEKLIHLGGSLVVLWAERNVPPRITYPRPLDLNIWSAERGTSTRYSQHHDLCSQRWDFERHGLGSLKGVHGLRILGRNVLLISYKLSLRYQLTTDFMEFLKLSRILRKPKNSSILRIQ